MIHFILKIAHYFSSLTSSVFGVVLPLHLMQVVQQVTNTVYSRTSKTYVLYMCVLFKMVRVPKLCKLFVWNPEMLNIEKIHPLPVNPSFLREHSVR